MLANDFKLITKARAAEIFGVDVKTIDNYIKAGHLRQPQKFVSKEYWHPDDFEAFLNETFRLAPRAMGEVAGVTEQPAGVPDAASAGRATSAMPAKPSLRVSKPEVRGKDTSPVVRERARRKALLDELNAAD